MDSRLLEIIILLVLELLVPANAYLSLLKFRPLYGMRSSALKQMLTYVIESIASKSM